MEQDARQKIRRIRLTKPLNKKAALGYLIAALFTPATNCGNIALMIRTLALILLFGLFGFLAPAAGFAQSAPQQAQKITPEELAAAKARAAEEAYEKRLAEQDLHYRDSIDYTIDDGIMTKAEMVQEAEYIFGLCTNNAFQKKYFDCRCLSGAFLSERERLGPTAMQFDIMQRLTNSDKAVCASPANLAGDTYSMCMEYNKYFRELAHDQEDMCICAANKAASEFAKNPRLDPSYVGMLNTRYMIFCSDPQNRDKDKAAKAAAKALAPPLPTKTQN